MMNERHTYMDMVIPLAWYLSIFQECLFVSVSQNILQKCGSACIESWRTSEEVRAA
jgi:hypothetical protein